MSPATRLSARTFPVAILAGILACLFFIVATPKADASLIGDAAIQIDIFDADGNKLGSHKFEMPASAFDHVSGRWNWSADVGDGIQIRDQGRDCLLATITSLNCVINEDPSVDLNFSVVAGSTDTIFVISSPVLTFSTLTNPDAKASAGITVTDTNADMATLTGKQTDAKAYKATYNGSTDWALLISPVSAFDGTGSGTDRKPASPTPWETIPGAVSSIQSQFYFELTAGDSASGTSHFEVVPEPATLGLLGLGMVVMMVTRRRKSA